MRDNFRLPANRESVCFSLFSIFYDKFKTCFQIEFSRLEWYMDIVEFKNMFVIKVSAGEKLMESIFKFMNQQDIQSGSINGIGALENTKIGYFDRNQKKYLYRVVEPCCELVSLTGNLAWADDGKPIAHIHVALGLPDYSVVGGHLVEGTVGVVGEMIVVPNKEKIIRRRDEGFGLQFMDLG
jgi:predicted DNA-binding protein with PD1-like motif